MDQENDKNETEDAEYHAKAAREKKRWREMGSDSSEPDAEPKVDDAAP